tara:strand:+ start:2380 stop:3927 length:1548 start_codon:yes stop_codon:yes gene_type:complete
MWENLKNIILKHKFPLMLISYIIIIFTLMTKGILMPNLLGSLILIGGLFGILTFNLLKFISNKNMALFMIGVLVVLTLLILLLLFLANSTSLILTFNKLLTVFSVIAIISVVYFYLESNYGNKVRKITRSPFIKYIYYSVFLIPCLFGYFIEYLYYQVKHTPSFVYWWLLFDVIVLFVFFLKKGDSNKTNYLYINNPRNIKRDIDENISEIEQSKKELLDLVKKLKDFDVKKRSTDELWKKIIEGDLNDVKNKNKLKALLLNNGWRNEQICNNTITNSFEAELCRKEVNKSIIYIQQNTSNILKFTSDIETMNDELKELQKQRNNINNKNTGILLLNEPKNLNKETLLSNYDVMKEASYIGNDKVYSYGISMWIFLHPNPPNVKKSPNKYVSIFNYNNKPKVDYDPLKNVLRFTLNKGANYTDKILFKTHNVPLQKWNNLVINYENGTYDIFMNNKLINTFSGVVPYMTNDSISVGELNGINGGIANVVYYPTYLPKIKMDENYKLFKNKKTPII